MALGALEEGHLMGMQLENAWQEPAAFSFLVGDGGVAGLQIGDKKIGVGLHRERGKAFISVNNAEKKTWSAR
jgi:hypothetical protein